MRGVFVPDRDASWEDGRFDEVRNIKLSTLLAVAFRYLTSSVIKLTNRFHYFTDSSSRGRTGVRPLSVIAAVAAHTTALPERPNTI